MKRLLLTLCTGTFFYCTGYTQVFSLNEDFNSIPNPDNLQVLPTGWSVRNAGQAQGSQLFDFSTTSGVNEQVLIVAELDNNETVVTPFVANGKGMLTFKARASQATSNNTKGFTVEVGIRSGSNLIFVQSFSLTNSFQTFTADFSSYPNSGAVQLGFRNPDLTGTNIRRVDIDDVTYTSGCPAVPAAVARTQNITISLDATGNAIITPEDVDNGSTDECGDPLASLALDITSFDCNSVGQNTVTLTATTTGGEVDTETAIVTLEPNLGSWEQGDDPIKVSVDASGVVSVPATDFVDFECSGLDYFFDESTTIGADCQDLGDIRTVQLEARVPGTNQLVGSKDIQVEIVDDIPPTLSIASNTATVNLDPTSNTATLDVNTFTPTSSDNCSANVFLSQSTFGCSDVGDQIIQVIAEDAGGNRVTEDISVTITGTITQQTVSSNAPTGSACPDGTAYTITVDGSQTGFDYVLTDQADGSVIAGPTAGTGSSIDFNSGAVSETTTFEVLAETGAVVGNALLFEGDNDKADASTSWDFDFTQGFTLEFSYSGVTQPTNFFNTLFALGRSSENDFEVYFQENTSTLVIGKGRGRSDFQANQYTSPSNNTAIHIAIAYNPAASGEKVAVFYDGIEQTPVSSTIPRITAISKNASNLWQLGANAQSQFGSLNAVGQGAFDEMRIWRTARTASEIMGSMDACVDPGTTGLVHYYKFDENGGLTISDAVGSLDLTITNANSSSNWTTELINCGSSCSTPMANTVTIGDSEVPTLSVFTSLDLTLNANGASILDLANAVNSAADNCTDSTALSFTADIVEFSCNELGANTVTIKVEDEAGNETTQSITINVLDELAPAIAGNNMTFIGGFPPIQITLPPLVFDLNAQGEVNISLDELRSTVSDNCDSDPAVSLDKTRFTCADLGTQTISITATDAEGNQATTTETIVINDATAPIVTVLNPQVFLDADGEVSLTDSDLIDTVSDNCTSIENLVVDIPAIGIDCENAGGTVQVDFTVTDESGNVTNASSIVEVLDNIDPLAIAQDITLDRGVSFTAQDVDNGSSDNCSVSLSLDQNVFNTVGTETIILTATDPSGNTATATATITVVEPRDPQTITFPTIPDGVYGDEITLAATSSSGLGIDYAVTTGPARMSSNVLIFTGVGQVTVTATQDGNNSFSPADPVSRSATASKATLQAVADNKTITFGDPEPDFTVSYVGFVEQDEVSDLDKQPTVSVANTSTITSDREVFTITPSGGSDDLYDFTYANGLYTILKASQTITFPLVADVDLADGNTITLNATTTSGLGVVYSAQTGGSFVTITGNEIRFSGVGSVAIRAAQSGNTNYLAATPVDVSFEVTDSRKQDQTITFDALSDATYGDGSIALAATSSSGLTVSYMVSGVGSLTSNNEVEINGTGTVTVTASQAGDNDFNPAADVIRSFTVEPASITITPDDQQITIGEPLPNFTFTYSGFVNGEDESVFDFLPVVGSPTANILSEGTYPIVVTQDAIASNYVFTNEEGNLTVSKPLNVSELAVEIYPNPASESLTIIGIDSEFIDLISATGSIRRLAVKNQQIDVSTLSRGVYFIQIKSNDNAVEVKKIVLR